MSPSPTESPRDAQPAGSSESIASRRSRSSSTASRGSNLSLDLSNIPPLQQPTPPSNTLLFTNLNDPATFTPENLATIRNLISASAFIHAFAPLKSFRRIVVSFFDEESAIRVRGIWDGEAVLGQRLKVYFGQNTPVRARDEHLALPDAGKLFFISPPPSPPHGWEMRREDAPNKLVHADDLASALARLGQSDHHHQPHPSPDSDSPVTPLHQAAVPGQRRSRSSTLVYQPDADSPHMPAVVVEDTTDDDLLDVSPMEAPKAPQTRTARPPIELMNDS